MKILNKKIKALCLTSLLITVPLSLVSGAMTYSGNSINSLSISSNRTENSYHYLIEIHIEGIKTSNVIFETDFQTLYLLAQSEGVISEFAIAGSQVVRLAFDFPANANLKNYFRVNKPNKILISVPKS